MREITYNEFGYIVIRNTAQKNLLAYLPDNMLSVGGNGWAYCSLN